MISMSAVPPSARAASPTSFIRRLTARLVLGEIRIGMRADADSSAAALGRVESGGPDDAAAPPAADTNRRSPGPPAAWRSRS